MLEPVLVVIGPAVSAAALLGLLLFVLSRRERPRRAMIDPIEANALHGGRMSVRDSGLVAVQNVVSNGSGASVGLEAGYTQLCAGFASRLGIAFELRRSDLRTLVGCGSAAAIAAAFEAPLTGAFYAFELIIGTYSIAILTPVVVAALCGSLVAKALVAQPALVAGSRPELRHRRRHGHRHAAEPDAGSDLRRLSASGSCAASPWWSRASAASRVPAAVAPMLGGLLRRRPRSGGLAAGPLGRARRPALAVRGGGPAIGALALAVLFLAKAAASAISIGCGFRGGLFFASLFLGALRGQMLRRADAARSLPGLVAFGLTPLAYAVVGMSALAVAVVGGPLTMTFLALELTGSFPITGLVLVAVIASSLTVRKTFGYSFATWRFHLRGESIRSAHDVGWIRSLTVAALMRRDATTVDLTTSLPAFLAEHPLGSSSRVIVVDDADRYAGIVLVPEAHAARQAAARADDPPRLTDLVRYPDAFLLPEMNAKAAAAAFDRSESEALAVLESRDTRRVIGLLTESHTLKRYSEELDRQRQAMVGEAV